MAYRRGDKIISYPPTFVPFVLLFQLCLCIARCIDWFLLHLTIKGRENLRGIQSAILVSNHTLVVDPGVIAHAIRPRRTYFTMLEETALIPYLGTFVRLIGGIPIPLNSIRRLEDAVIQGLDGMGFIHFFPEGECYLWNQQIRPFSLGAFYLACRRQVPVIPITTVLHERRLFGRSTISILRRTLRVPPRVSVILGKPLFPKDFLVSRHAPSNMGVRSTRLAAGLMSEEARRQMQDAIDCEGGSKTLYRGMMPRIPQQNNQQK